MNAPLNKRAKQAFAITGTIAFLAYVASKYHIDIEKFFQGSDEPTPEKNTPPLNHQDTPVVSQAPSAPVPLTEHEEKHTHHVKSTVKAQKNSNLDQSQQDHKALAAIEKNVPEEGVQNKDAPAVDEAPKAEATVSPEESNTQVSDKDSEPHFFADHIKEIVGGAALLGVGVALGSDTKNTTVTETTNSTPTNNDIYIYSSDHALIALAYGDGSIASLDHQASNEMLSVSIGAEAHGLGSEASIIGNVFGTARYIHSTASGDDSYSLVSLDAVDAFSVSSEIGSIASGAGARSVINLNELVLISTDIQIESTATSSEALIGLANVSGSINELNLLSDGNGAQSSLNLEEATLSINKLNLVTDHGGFVSLDLTGSVVTIDDTISIEAHHSGDVVLTANIDSSDFNNIHVSAGTYGYVSVDLLGNITADNIYISTSSEANVHVSIDQITLNGNIELYSSSLSSEVSGDWSTSSLDIQSLSGNLDHITLSAKDGGGTLLNVNGNISVNTIHLYASGDDYNGGISTVLLDGSGLDATLQDFTLEAYGGGDVNALLGNLSISGNLTLHADGYGTDVYGSTGDLNLSRIDLMAAINDSVFSSEDYGIHNISVIASDDGYVSLNLYGGSMGMDGNLEVAAYHHGVAEVLFSSPLFMAGGNLSVAAEGFSISLDDTNESLEEYYGSTDLWAYTNFNLSLDSGSYINDINITQSYLGEVDVHLEGNYFVGGDINVTTYNDDGYGWGGGYASLDLGDGSVHVSGDITVTANNNENAFLTGSDILFSPSWYPGALALSSGSITVTAYSGDASADLMGSFEVNDIHVASYRGFAGLDLIGTTHVYGDISVQASSDNARAYLYANLSGSDLNNIIVSAEYSAEISVDLSGDFHADHLMVRASGDVSWGSYNTSVPYIYFSGDAASTINLHNLTVSSDISHVNVILDGNLEIDGNINVSARGANHYDGADLVPAYSSSTLKGGGGSVDFVNAEGSSLHDISVTSQTYGDSRAYLGGNITVDGSIEIRAGGWSAAYSDDSFSILSLEHATLNHANLTMFELGSNTNTLFNYQSLQGTIDDLNLRAQSGGSVSLDMSPAENHIRISGDILAVAHGNATLHLSADINGSTLHNISVEAYYSSESNVNLLGSITVDGQISIDADYGSSANLNLQSVDFENTNLYMQNANFNYSASTGNINDFTDIVYGSSRLSDEASHWDEWFETQINGDIYLATHYESSLDLTLLDVNSLGSNINLTSYQNSFISADIQSLTGTVDHLNISAGSWQPYYPSYCGEHNANHTQWAYANEVQLSIDSMSATIDSISMDSTINDYWGFSSDFSVDIQGKVNINQSGNIFINPGSDDALSLNLDEVNANISHISIGNVAASVNSSSASLQMNAVYGDIFSVFIGNDGYTGSEAAMTIGNESNRLGLISDVIFNEVSLHDNGSLNLYVSDHNVIYASVDTFNVFEGELNLQSFGSNSMISLDVGSLSPYSYSSGSILLSTDISSDNQTINLGFESANFTSLDLTINALGHNSDITFSAPTATGNIHDLVLETSSTGSELYVDLGHILVHGNVDVTGASGGKTTLTNSGGSYDLQSLSLTGDGGNAYVHFTNAHINIHDTLTLSNQSSDSNVWLYVDSGISFDDANLIIEDVGASNNITFIHNGLSGTIHDLSLNFSADTSFTLDLGGSISIDHDISVRAHSGDYVHLIGNIDGSNIHDFTAIAEGGSNVTISLAGSVDVSGNVLLSTDGSDNSLNVYINHTHFDNANLTINKFGTNSTVDVIHPLNISGDFNNISIREKNGSHTSLISSENWLPFNGSYLLDADSASSYITVDVGNLTLGRTIDSIILSADHSADVSLTVDNALSLSGDISINASNSGSVFATLNISSTDALHAIDIETLNSGYANISLQGNITLGSGDAEATHDGLFITANTWNNSSEITLGNIEFNDADLSLHAENAGILSGYNLNFDSVSGTIDNLTLYGNNALVSLDLTGNLVTIHDTISIEAHHAGVVYLTANIDGSNFNNINVSADSSGYVSVDLQGDITLGSSNLEVTTDGLFITANTWINSSEITLGSIEFNRADLSLHVENGVIVSGYNLNFDSVSGTIDNLTLYGNNALVSLDLTGNLVTIHDTISIEAHDAGVSLTANIDGSDFNNIHVSADSSGYVSVDLQGDITAQNIYISTSSEGFASADINQVTLSGNIELYSAYASDGVATSSDDWTISSLDIQSLSGDLDRILVSAEYGGYSWLSINGNFTVNDIVLSADSHSINISSEADLSGNMDGSTIGHLSLDTRHGGVVNARLLGEISVTDTLELTASGHEVVGESDFQSSAYLSAEVTGTIGTISVSSDLGGSAIANLMLSDITVTDLMLVSADHSTTSLSLGHVIFDSADLSLFNNSGDFHINYNSISGTIDNLALRTYNGGNISFDSGSVDIFGNVSLYSYGTSSLSMLSSDHATSLDLQSIHLEAYNQGTSFANFLTNDISVANEVNLYASGNNAEVRLDAGLITFNSADLTIEAFNTGEVIFGHGFHASGTIDNLTVYGYNALVNLDISGDVHIHDTISLEAQNSADVNLTANIHGSSFNNINVSAYTNSNVTLDLQGNITLGSSNLEVTTDGLFITSHGWNNASNISLGNIHFNHADLSVDAQDGTIKSGHQLNLGHVSGTIENLSISSGGLVSVDLTGNVQIEDTISIEAYDGNLHLTANIDGSSFNTLHVSTDMGSTLDLDLQGSITLGSGNVDATHDGVFITSSATNQSDEITLGSIEFNHADLSLHAVDEGWISADIQSISGTIDNLSLQVSDARIYLHIGEDAVDSIGNITVSADGGSAILESASMDHDITLQNIKVISSSGGNAFARLAGGDITVTEGILISTDSTTTTSATLLVINVIFDSADLSIHAFDGRNNLNFAHDTLSGTIDNLSLATANGSVWNLDLGSDVDISGNITVTSATNSESSLTANLGIADVDYINLETVNALASINLSGNVTVHGGVLLSADASSDAYLNIAHLHFDYASLTINEAGSDGWDTHTASFNIGSVSGTIDGLFLRVDDGALQGYNLSGNSSGAIFSGADIISVDIVGDIGLTSNGVGSSLELYGFSSRTGSHFGNISAVASDDGWLHLDAGNGFDLTIDGNLEIASYFHGNAIVDFGHPITMAGGDLTVIAEGISASIDSEDLEDEYGPEGLWAYTNFNVSLDSGSYINNINVSQSYLGEANVHLDGDYSVVNISVTTYNDDGSGWGGGYASLDLGTGVVNVSGNIEVSASRDEHANLSGNLDGSTLENIYISNDGGFVDVNLSGTFDVTGNIGLVGYLGQLSMDLSIEGSSINAIALVSNSGDITLNLTGAGTVTDTINVIGAPFYYYAFDAQGGGHSSLSGSVDGSIFHNMTAISVIDGVAEVDLSGNVTLTGTLSVKALDFANTIYCSESTNANDVIMQFDRSDDPTFSPSTYVAFDHINFNGANLVIDKAGSSADLHLIINDASGTLNHIEVNAESGAHLSYYLPDNVSMSGDLTVKAVADNYYSCGDINDIYFTSVSFGASLANSFINSIDIEASNLSYDIGGGDYVYYQGAFVSAHILGSINVQNINVSASAEDRASLILDHVNGPIDQVNLSVGEANSEDLSGSADVNFAAHFDSAGYVHNLYINSATHFFLTDSNNVTVDISQSTFGGNVFILSEFVVPGCVTDDNHINLTYHGATASFISIDQDYEGYFDLTIDIGDQNYLNANDILKTSLTIDGLYHVSSDLSLNHLSGEMYINTSYEIDFNSMFIDAKDKIENHGMNFYFAQLSGSSNDGYLFYDSNHNGITQMIELINVNESMMTAYSYDFARQFGATDFTYTLV